jgi:hypothetical protein
MFGVYNEQNNCITTLELDKEAFLRSREQLKDFKYPNIVNKIFPRGCEGRI